MSLLDQLTPPVPDRSALAPATFRGLRDVIRSRTGIHFRDNKRYLLESQVGRRLQALGLPDYEAYLRLLSNGGLHRELPQLINAVTINETYFFRHPEQYRGLIDELVPALLRGRPVHQPLRIWSAACSNGAEPYTLALMLREHAGLGATRIEIVGTDIDTDILAEARSGRYRPYAVRNVTPELLDRYFRREGDVYVLEDAIRRMVTFRKANLVDTLALRSLRPFDIILCANVLIYFDTEVKERVVASLYDALRPGGYLLVGNSETLYGVSRAFEPVRINNTIAYQREPRHD